MYYFIAKTENTSSTDASFDLMNFVLQILKRVHCERIIRTGSDLVKFRTVDTFSYAQNKHS